MILLLVSFFAVLFAPANVLADGGFVVRKFVWDKHKDIAEPTQKAILVFDAGREDMILQVKYEGPVDEFGWLIPVPNLPTVEKGSMKCFYELSRYTQRHFEPPVYEASPGSLGLRSADSGPKPEPPVKVIETKTVGDYDIAVLSTKDADALQKWLDANQFYFPPNKSDVLDSYVKQHWYFVAVKISLAKSFPGLISTASKLASGELNPLQISFASERCVFPLKISSINGKPSEIQVYVLSPEPLLERAMLEKQLPVIYSNGMARARNSAQTHERMQLMQRNRQRRFMGGSESASPLSSDSEKAIQNIVETPIPGPDDLLPYAKVTKADLPDSCKWIPRLAEKSWWLTKQTWTFRPEEMHDLEFESAFGVFAEQLGSRYGYFAAASLISFGPDSVPTTITAMQSTNPTARVNAVKVFYDDWWGFATIGRASMPVGDSRIVEAALTWLKDSEPAVRCAAVLMLTGYGNWNSKYAEPVVAMLRDTDPGVRHAVVFALPRFRGDLEKYIPSIQKMLKDPDANARAASLEILDRLNVEAEISRADLLSFFTSPDYLVLNAAFTQLGGQHGEVSGDEALVMLQSPQIVARLLGLHALDQKREKQSVALALPLLRDPDEMVRLKAAQTLRALTGQQFSEDQADEWTKWWVKSKTNFVVQPHPEELRPNPFQNRN
jgi:HEAT repeat protein